MKRITIKNTKGIRSLTFDMPARNGVYLLVGANGAGKSTLLTCINRIANKDAFAFGFKSASVDTGIDQYGDAAITYQTEHQVIKFQKKSKRWASTPKTRSSDLLRAEFGFQKTVYVQADAKRIDVTQDEIVNGAKESASPDMIVALNTIFETRRFTQLKRLKNVRGRGRQAVYFYVLKENGCWFSEKRFSTGEMAIIHMVEQLLSAENGTLFLLDEAELALHPRIQKNLLDYIRIIASEKNLMVFIATHSITMIKASDPQSILLLEDRGRGDIHIETPCYPAYAIGNVDFLSNMIFDLILFVEDDMARLLLKAMISVYMLEKPEKRLNQYQIIPVGGYEQTAALAINVNHNIFQQSKVHAFLDQDAQTEGLPGNPKFRTMCDNDREHIIHFLPCTPELWFIDTIENATDDLKNEIRRKYCCEVDSIIQSEAYRGCNSGKPRRKAKQQFDVVIASLALRSVESIDVVTKDVIQLLVEKCMKKRYIMSTVAVAF